MGIGINCIAKMQQYLYLVAKYYCIAWQSENPNRGYGVLYYGIFLIYKVG